MRGWPVVDRDKEPLGKVDALMADPDTGNVRYIQVELDEKLLNETSDSWGKSSGSSRGDLMKTGAMALIPVGMAYVARDEKKIMADTATRSSYGTAPRHTRQDSLSSDYEEQVRDHYLKKHEPTTPENSDTPQVNSRAEGMSSKPVERNKSKSDNKAETERSPKGHSGGKLSAQPMRPERLHTSGNTPGAPDSLEAGAVSAGSMGGSIESSAPKGRVEQSRLRKDRGDVTSFYGHDIYNEDRFFRNH